LDFWSSQAEWIPQRNLEQSQFLYTRSLLIKYDFTARLTRRISWGKYILLREKGNKRWDFVKATKNFILFTALIW
jgi:hypothetical protein